jgi:crotonobetainyl-CoA hydratase
MEMLFTGLPIDAGTALQVHLVNRVVATGRALDGALALAGVLLECAPLSLRATKRLAHGVLEGDLGPHWEHSAVEGMNILGSADAMEGPTAFAQKRPPVWQGR